MSLDLFFKEGETQCPCHHCEGKGYLTEYEFDMSVNITHNLGTMADEAGIYNCLWRPEEHNLTHAGQLIEPLRAGLVLLKSDPERFKKFNASNGWGLYDNFVPFVEQVLEICEAHPDAEISAWR